jgi:hypothetical protein
VDSRRQVGVVLLLIALLLAVVTVNCVLLACQTWCMRRADGPRLQQGLGFFLV